MNDVDIAIEQELSGCILKLSETYFNKELPIVVQTPAMWYPRHDWKKNYGDILLHTLYHYNQIPQVTVGYEATKMKIGYQLKTHNAVQPGSYILQIPRGDRHEDRVWIELTLLRLAHDVYNPNENFIIALNYFPYSYQRTAKGLFTWALEKGFINVIIMIPKRNSKRSTTTYIEQLDIFGWIPDEQENICSMEVDQIIHLDSWDVENKTFVSNTNLFPKKKLTNMHYCPINAFLGVVPPFIFPKNGMLFGSFIEVIQEYCARSKCGLISVTDARNNHIAFPTGYGSYIHWREGEFLYPYFILDFTWYVPSGSQVEPWKSLFKAFTFKMWLLVVICSALGSLFLWLLDKFGNVLINGNMKILSISALKNHIGNSRNKGPGHSFFVTLWLFYCLLINTAYQSTLFGLMVNPGEYPPIETFEELKKSGLTMKTLVEIVGREDDKYEYKLCEESCLKEIAEYRNLSTLYSTYSGELITPSFIDDRGKPKVVPLKEVVYSNYAFGQIIQLSSLIHNTLNTLLHRASASGLIEHWNRYHIEEWLYTFSYREIERVFALSLYHVQGAFYILGAGFLIAFVLFFIEILNYNFCGSVPIVV
ncbi:Ionotropic receptor 354 [Blattella germanica]|nr:Ionotropic receptor 354 [Blattella germanica]